MAHLYQSDTRHPIIFQMNKAHLTKQDLCKALNVELNTLNAFIKRPGLIRLEYIILLSGLFGLAPEELLYIIIRNKYSFTVKGKWYIEEIRDRYKDK